ncbi:hypothetical protein [Nocardia aurea]|uniref:hypothetical protein n=1 Tax=Nocardia aurea TaxID=2144174 RepID=UPI00130051A5|nr:hypothetical protein [Nocardia aurea]
MIYPNQGGELSGWRAGLLARIQDRTADHARVLRQGFPEYKTEYGRGDVALQRWRSNLRDLAADRDELAVRAAASGVPEAAITAAVEAGRRGRRWEHNRANPPTTRHGEDPIRGQMIAAMAEDMWTLEHMAAVSVATEFRFLGDVMDAEGPRQYLVGMGSLWHRVDAQAMLADLTPGERADLWGRDEQGWRRLVATVAGYDDAQLLEQFRAYSWSGIEWDVTRTTENLNADLSDLAPPETRPPTPEELLDRAAYFVHGTLDPDILDDHGRSIDRAVDAAAADTTTTRTWGSEPVGEVIERPPEPDPATGLDW